MGTKVKISQAVKTKISIESAMDYTATSRTRTPYDKHEAYDTHTIYLNEYDESKPQNVINRIKRG